MEHPFIFSRDAELESLLIQLHELERQPGGEHSPPAFSNETGHAMESSGGKKEEA